MARVSNETKSALEVGRFSTQTLEQFGAQKSVKYVEGTLANEYTGGRGNEVFASPGALEQSTASLTVGSYSSNTLSAVKAYFMSRGASESNANVMASLTMEVSKTTGRSPISVLNYNAIKSASFETEMMNYLNRYRPLTQQQDVLVDTNNKQSIKKRTIRA